MRRLVSTFSLPGWMEAEWTVRRRRRARAIVRRDFADVFERLGLVLAADLSPGELPAARPLRSAGGRGPLATIPADRLGEAVVRPYRRGGLPARILTRRYFLGDRAFRELIVAESLRRAGVPVVETLAAIQSSARPGYRAALVTRRVVDAVPAPGALVAAGDGASGRRDDLRRMGRSARRLHAAGGFHADLNVHNFLLPAAPDAEAVLLDFDRARLLTSPLPRLLARWNLRRLRRSLAKTGLDAALSDWEVFREGYDDPSPGREPRSRGPS